MFDIINYHQEFKTSIFTASVTMGSFLFTMKSFIIQVMKTNVYESELHQDAVSLRRGEGKKEGYFDGLLRIKSLLLIAIILAFGNAIMQLAIGGFKTELSAWCCMILTFLTIFVIMWCVLLISGNLTRLLEYANALAIKKKG